MILLENVLGYFPEGTTVHAYREALEDSGNLVPLGPSLDSAVVTGGDLSFGSLENDGTTVVLGAKVAGKWVLLRRTSTVPAGADAAILEQLELGGKGFKEHGANPAALRPTGFASVEWIGSVEPENAVDGDTWIET